jgi:hypothetical protein
MGSTLPKKGGSYVECPGVLQNECHASPQHVQRHSKEKRVALSGTLSLKLFIVMAEINLK